MASFGVREVRHLANGRGPRHRQARLLIVAALVAAIVALASYTEPFRLMEARVFDYLSTIAPPRRPADGPVIVAIDEPSFSEIGLQWPWPRSLHANLVNALRRAGATAVGLDIVFAEPSTAEADAALAAAMGPDVTLAGDVSDIRTPHADQHVRVEPLPALVEPGARVGIASVALDADGTQRRIPLFPDSFAMELLRSAGKDPDEPPAGALLQAFGPSRTYDTVSYYQALDPDAFLPEGYLKGRTVIVGLSMQTSPTVEAGGADAFATSFTPRTRRLVSGAEVQATIYDNLAHGLFITETPAALGLIAVALSALLGAATAWRGTGWRTAALSITAVAVFAVASFLLLRFGRIHVGPIAPALAFAGITGLQAARDYAAERQQRRTITRAFSQYLPPVLVQRLAADPSLLRLGGERRTISILFSDIRGFTTIAEGMKDEPERLTALINRLLNPLSNAVLANGGTIDKYIGDAIMALWNAPLDDPDHPLHAVNAGLAMLRALDEVNAQLAAEAAAEGKTAIALKIGVGINTGDCVVGNMGSDMRFDYTALGDAVNLASRFEGETKAYGVSLLVGAATAARIRGHFPLAELDRVRVKGKSEPVAIFAVLPNADEEALAGHEGLIADHYAGRLRQDDPRLNEFARRIPALAGYYETLSERLPQPA